MRLIVGNREVSTIITQRFDSGSCILCKYGKGSGGDILLKQFLFGNDEDQHSVLISTHESEKELETVMERMESTGNIEMISLQPIRDSDLRSITKKDRFRNEGIMVTDLLEVSSYSGVKKEKEDPGFTMLSRISNIAQNQVLPFRLILDSLSDLVLSSDPYEVEKRIRILKKTLKEKGGFALVAAPLDWDVFDDMETTLFDGVIEITAYETSSTWKREFKICNSKGMVELPEKWEVTILKDIPMAKSLE